VPTVQDEQRRVNILHLHPGPDTGGTSVRAKAALEATGDEVRVFAGVPHPFGYPAAEAWDDRLVSESIDWSDVVVVHNEPSLWLRVARGRVKPLVIHHHGSRLRRHAVDLFPMGVALRAVQVVSTVDLLTSVYGTAYWMPQVLDLPLMASVRAQNAPGPDDPIRVAHAPTNRQIKGTRHLQRAVRKLGGEVELVYIRNKPWMQCLERKATAHLYFDQHLLGYGNNSLEAWGMGMPVIAGASPVILDRMRKEWGALPFYLMASPVTLDVEIGAMARSSGLRDEWAGRGMEHVLRYHTPQAVAERAHDLYEQAIRSVASAKAVA
jgi:glycosyltransferase involved in cell wall biosynthesis